MYTLTLEINQICNFKCSYCYLGEKNGKVMSEDVAYAGIDLALLNVQKHQDKRLWVDFVGGEALLSFEMICKIVRYIEKQILRKDITVNYSITTNGSIMNKEILRFFIDKKVHIKLSIDGDKMIHNRNRKLLSGKGSFELIEKNLISFKLYEKYTSINIQAAHVITHNNYKEIFYSVRYLVDKLGFNIIDSSLDNTEKWSRDELDILANEWEKIICYYLLKYKQKEPFLWGAILDMMKYEKSQKISYCGVGLVRIYVRYDGRIYGCAANLSESGLIGNVWSGFTIKRIEMLRNIQRGKGLCRECDFGVICNSKECIMNNLEYSGRTDKVKPNDCYFEKKIYNLWEKYKNDLKITLGNVLDN